ncbi:hypothetical protein [Streptomyces sp. NPDC017230]|uniref:hypothetical protein n=1 Tax=unclassified Streptomyces TaxID=2593676 RepID=UPI0037BD6B6A
MADEQDRWLDRETAEILLRGESPEAVDPAVRDRAERLARALGALSAPPVPSSAELPGEAAALAAFRKVRAERADAGAGTSDAPGRGAAPRPSDAGLVRIGKRDEGAGRPRWSRHLRLGLAAALTVGMVGSVAVAAGTGVLPTPFDGAEPEPGATVSAAASPDRPLSSPSPLDGARGGSTPGGARPGAPERDGAGGGTAEDRDSGSASDDRADGSRGGRPGLAASCREMGAGKEVEGARSRALKEAAGGSSRVGKYCRSLLAGTDGAAQDRDSGTEGRAFDESAKSTRERETERETGDSDDKNDKSDKNAKGDKGGKGDEGGKGGEGGKKGGDDKGGKDDEDDDGPHIAPPAGHHHDPHAPSAFVPLPQQRPNHPPHTSSAVINAVRPALSQDWNGSLAEGVTLSAAVAQ